MSSTPCLRTIRSRSDANEICREAGGLFPVQRMSSAGIHYELRAREGRCEGLLLAPSERVLVSPDYEGGRFDRFELPRKIGFQEAFTKWIGPRTEFLLGL